MQLSDVLHNRRQLLLKLKEKKVPPSPARTILLNLIKAPNQEVIEAAADAWMQKQFGVKPLNSKLKVPNALLPDAQGPHEFFQYITDALKSSI